MVRTIEELTDCTDGTGGTGAWVMDDVFADIVLGGVVCYGQLSGVVTAMEYDFSAGGGNTIQVRYVSPRTASCASKTETYCCTCLSEASTTFGTYSIRVRAWGDYDLVCGFSIWSAKGNVVALILKEMAKRMAMCRDAEIWSNLTDDFTTPNFVNKTEVSCEDGQISGSCCTFTYDLYNSIVSVIQHLRGDAYDPDYVIMHPNVAAYLYYKDAAGYFYDRMPGTTYDKEGNLQTIRGCKVIESCNATDCNDTGALLPTNKDGIMAVVLDSARAVGEVWGKRPIFHEFYDAKCDRYEEVLWQYWGSNAMDTNAIGWVTNP